MEQFFLQVPTIQSSFKIKHGDGILLIGSCFSDEMANKLVASGHHVLSNPHGTVFHPGALAYNLMDALNDELDNRIFEREGKFYSWNTSTVISGETKEELEQKLLAIKSNYRAQLKTAKLLVVTFGTAWGYELQETNELVANCHKMPNKMFGKFLSSPYEIVQDWILALEKIQAYNPTLEIIFTVSPVRHIKDGIVENNLSKARLIEAVHQLSYEDKCQYFPSYELVIDVLRDYRFYKADKIHPSEEAVNFIWNHFQATYFSTKSIEINQEVEQIQRMKQHSPSNNALHQQKINDKIAAFLARHPECQADLL